MKTITKLMMGLMLIIALMSLVNAQSYWYQNYQNVDNKPVLGDGDNAFLTRNSLELYTSGDSSSAILIGNLDSNENTRELLIIDDSRNAMWTTTPDLNLIYNGSSSGGGIFGVAGDFDIAFQYVLFDYDLDGEDELIILKSKSGITNITLYDQAVGQFQTVQQTSIAKTVTNKGIACVSPYCYFQDNTGVMYKYHPSTNSIVSSINQGTTSNSDSYRLTIDDCVSDIPGDEIVWILDNDGDGYWNDLAVVPIDSFSLANTVVYNFNNTANLLEFVTCESIDANPQIYLKWESYTIDYPGVFCGFPLVEEDDVWNFTRAEIFNNTDVLINNSIIVQVENNQFSKVPKIWTGTDFFFTDKNGDSNTDYCIAGRLTGDDGTSFCASSDYRYFSCYSSNNTQLNEIYVKDDIQSIRPIKSYVTDFDNDGEDEVLLGNLLYNPNSDTISSIGDTIPTILSKSFSHFTGVCLQWYYYENGILYSTESSSSQCVFETAPCSGFVNPNICVGDCHFTDNFNYANYSVECNGWLGSAKSINPINDVFSVVSQPISKTDIYVDDTIYESETYVFDVEFDFNLTSSTIWQFNILDNSLGNYLALITFENYIVRAYDNTPPTINTLGNVSPNTIHTLKLIVDLNNDEIDYYFDGGYITTGEFYDGNTDSARRFSVAWNGLTNDFNIDNFEITLLTANPSPTEPVEEVDYTYNPNFFCAINWTSNSSHKFSEQNCADRGFATTSPGVSLCMPRACLQDVGQILIGSVLRNILLTIIIILAIIILAPLVIKLLK